MAVSTLLFTVMSVAVKLASESLPSGMVVFFRNFFGIFFLLPWVARLGVANLGTSHWAWHILRALSGLGAMYCFFYGIAHLRLADAVVLNYTMPLFMPLVARVMIKEKTPSSLWAVLLVGFCGVGLVVKPGSSVFNPVALVGVAAGFLAAVAQVSIKKLTDTDPTVRIVFYFSVIASLLSAIPLIFIWKTPVLWVWGALLAAGALATIAQLFLTRAFSLAPAAQIGPFIYTSVVFAALFDWVLWRQFPDIYSILGTVLVVGAGIITLHLDPLPSTK